MIPLLLDPKDTLLVRNHADAVERYHVEGVYLGAVGCDSLIELRPLTLARGSVGPHRHNAFVPLVLLEAGVAAGAFVIEKYSDEVTEPARVKVAGLLSHEYNPDLVHKHLLNRTLCEEDLWMVLENANKVVIELRERLVNIRAEALNIMNQSRPPES